MACADICRPKKYTDEELRNFIDRVENVLQNPECRDEYVQFIKRIRRLDQVKFVKIWVLVNDLLENRPQTPEFVPKIEILKKEINNVRELQDFVSELSDNDNNKLIDLKDEVCKCLNKSYILFRKYLLKTYK